MKKQFEFHGVEAEKAEAMRRYNNQKRFRNITRAAGVAFFCYLWFPTVAVSLQATGGWFYRTGTVMLTNRTFVFFFINILVAVIFILSRDHGDQESTRVSSTEPDHLYDQYTSSFSAVTASDDDSKKQMVPTFITEVHEEVVVTDKQIVPAFATEEVVAEVVAEAITAKSETKKKVIPPVTEIRRTRSERKKKVNAPFRRTESADSGIERLNSEEFRLKVETFIMEKKKSLVQEENYVVKWEEHGSCGLELVSAADSSSGLC